MNIEQALLKTAKLVDEQAEKNRAGIENAMLALDYSGPEIDEHLAECAEMHAKARETLLHEIRRWLAMITFTEASDPTSAPSVLQ